MILLLAAVVAFVFDLADRASARVPKARLARGRLGGWPVR
jgi:hypothetical protein